MTSEPVTNHTWQVQEAKQRFSEVLRAVQRQGPQTITKHGEEVAVVVDIAEYRRLTGKSKSFVEHLLSFPTSPDDEHDIWAEIEAERKQQFARDVDLGIDE